MVCGNNNIYGAFGMEWDLWKKKEESLIWVYDVRMEERDLYILSTNTTKLGNVIPFSSPLHSEEIFDCKKTPLAPNIDWKTMILRTAHHPHAWHVSDFECPQPFPTSFGTIFILHRIDGHDVKRESFSDNFSIAKDCWTWSLKALLWDIEYTWSPR